MQDKTDVAWEGGASVLAAWADTFLSPHIAPCAQMDSGQWLISGATRTRLMEARKCESEQNYKIWGPSSAWT